MLNSNYQDWFLNGIPILLERIENNTKGIRLIKEEIPNQGRVIIFNGEIEEEGRFMGYANQNYAKELDNLFKQRQFLFLKGGYGVNIKIAIEENQSQLHSEKLGLYCIDFKFTTSAFSSNNLVEQPVQNIKDFKNTVDISRLEKMQNFFRSGILTISSIRGQIEAALTIVESVLNNIRLVQGEINAIQSTINETRATIDNLIAAPSSLMQSFDNLINSTTEIIEQTGDKFSSLLGISNDIQLSSTQESSENLLNSAIISSCISNYSNQILKKEFTYDYEILARNNEIKSFLSKIELIQNIEIRNELFSLLSQCIFLLNEKSEFTKRRMTYTTERETPMNILIYQIYGQMNETELYDYVDTLINWNNFSQYGFIPKNTEVVFYV